MVLSLGRVISAWRRWRTYLGREKRGESWERSQTPPRVRLISGPKQVIPECGEKVVALGR